MEIKNIVVAGGGILGSQIAFQSAFCGFDVTIYLKKECSIVNTKKRLDNLKNTYVETINQMDKEKKTNTWAFGISDYDSFNKTECLKKVDQVLEKINFSLDLEEISKNADLIIESLPENIDIKKEFYTSLNNFMKKDAIVVTNSSTIIPSKLAKYIKNSANFMSLHFANSIWKNNITEIMRHSKTDSKNFDLVIDFAKNINMIPLPLYKEKSGYLLNSMLIPLLFSALDLFVNDISDFDSINKAWKIGTGAPKGPFEILDTIGLNTAYNIVLMYVKVPSFLAPYNFKGMKEKLEEYINQGKLGKSSGEGFYKYK